MALPAAVVAFAARRPDASRQSPLWPMSAGRRECGSTAIVPVADQCEGEKSACPVQALHRAKVKKTQVPAWYPLNPTVRETRSKEPATNRNTGGESSPGSTGGALFCRRLSIWPCQYFRDNGCRFISEEIEEPYTQAPGPSYPSRPAGSRAFSLVLRRRAAYFRPRRTGPPWGQHRICRPLPVDDLAEARRWRDRP